MAFVDIDSPQWLWVQDNSFNGNDRAVEIEDDPSAGLTPAYIWITGNNCRLQGENAIYIDGGRSQPSFTHILDNKVNFSGNTLGAAPGQGAIHIVGDPTAVHNITDQGSVGEPNVIISRNIVEGVTLLEGIRVEFLHLCKVSHNHIENTGGDGLVVYETCGGEFDHNKIIWPEDDDLYDALVVDGDSDRNYIHHNYIVNDTDDPAGWRYGIHIADAGAWCNIVVDNVGTDGFGTDYIHDGGSNTILNHPNDPTYGDNYTTCWGS